MKTKIAMSMVVVAACFLGFSSTCFSDDIKYGIGASATQSGNTFFFPIKIPTHKYSFLIEPMISREKSNVTNNLQATNIGINTLKETSKETDYGVGFYFVSKVVNPNIDMIIGIRGTYIETEKNSSFYGDAGSMQYLKHDKHGFSLGPVIGWEYNFNEHITAGINFAYVYTKITGDDYDYFTVLGTYAPFDSKVEKYSTNTELFIKYYWGSGGKSKSRPDPVSL